MNSEELPINNPPIKHLNPQELLSVNKNLSYEIPRDPGSIFFEQNPDGDVTYARKMVQDFLKDFDPNLQSFEKMQIEELLLLTRDLLFYFWGGHDQRESYGLPADISFQELFPLDKSGPKIRCVIFQGAFVYLFRLLLRLQGNTTFDDKFALSLIAIQHDLKSFDSIRQYGHQGVLLISSNGVCLLDPYHTKIGESLDKLDFTNQRFADVIYGYTNHVYGIYSMYQLGSKEFSVVEEVWQTILSMINSAPLELKVQGLFVLDQLYRTLSETKARKLRLNLTSDAEKYSDLCFQVEDKFKKIYLEAKSRVPDLLAVVMDCIYKINPNENGMIL